MEARDIDADVEEQEIEEAEAQEEMLGELADMAAQQAENAAEDDAKLAVVVSNLEDANADVKEGNENLAKAVEYKLTVKKQGAVAFIMLLITLGVGGVVLYYMLK